MSKRDLIIQWKHIEVEGETCVRCALTCENIGMAIINMEEIFEKYNVTALFEDTVIPVSDLKNSNTVLIHNIPIEEILQNYKVSESECQSCCSILGNGKSDGNDVKTYCKTIIDDSGNVNEEISEKLIEKAIRIVLEKYFI